MSRSLFAFLLAGTALLSGCASSKSGAKPKNSAISANLEVEFRRRWIEQRTAELQAQGSNATTAQKQAEEEFRARYNFATDPTAGR